MEMRKDFESVSTFLYRLAGIGTEFDRLNNEDWPHLKNFEDFEKVYALPPPQRHLLEDLYGKGRECAIFMGSHLKEFNNVRRFPSLVSYIDSFDNTWAYDQDSLQTFIDKVKFIVESLDQSPWAVRKMVHVFESQLSLLSAVRDTVTLLKQTNLYKIEKGEMPVEKEPSITFGPISGKVNINSTDNSTNITVNSSPIFASITDAISNSSIEVQEKAQLLARIDAMKQAEGKPAFLDRYKEFMQNAANHMSVISPFIPALTSLIT